MVLAVLARPVGGWLSDRLHPVPVLVWCFAGVAAFAVVQAFEPTLMPVATVALLGMALLHGAASGTVFALVGKVAPADQVSGSPACPCGRSGTDQFRPYRRQSSTRALSLTESFRYSPGCRRLGRVEAGRGTAG